MIKYVVPNVHRENDGRFALPLMQWRASVHITQSLEERWRCPHQIVDETIAPMKHYTGFIPLCPSGEH